MVCVLLHSVKLHPLIDIMQRLLQLLLFANDEQGLAGNDQAFAGDNQVLVALACTTSALKRV